MSKARCLFVGRHRLVLDGLRHLLATEFDGLLVTPEPDSVRSAAIRFNPDIALIQHDHASDGIICGDLLHEVSPEIRVLLLTDRDRTDCTVDTISLMSPADELWQIIRQQGAPSLKRPAPPVARALTARNREVIKLLVCGMAMKVVAQRLGITARTVAFHKYHVMEANGLRDNADLLRFAALHGILP